VAEPPAVNASPLIFLARGGLLDFLQLVAETIMVPTSVLVEIQRRGPTDITAQALQNTAWIICIEDPPIPRLIQAWDLGEGESSVLAWGLYPPRHRGHYRRFGWPALCCRTWDPCERNSRSESHSKEAGRIPQARPVLERLRHAGMYLSDRVMNQALGLVGE
jgi:predicted nucleic acid-binding protein